MSGSNILGTITVKIEIPLTSGGKDNWQFDLSEGGEVFEEKFTYALEALTNLTISDLTVITKSGLLINTPSGYLLAVTVMF